MATAVAWWELSLVGRRNFLFAVGSVQTPFKLPRLMALGGFSQVGQALTPPHWSRPPNNLSLQVLVLPAGPTQGTFKALIEWREMTPCALLGSSESPDWETALDSSSELGTQDGRSHKPPGPPA